MMIDSGSYGHVCPPNFANEIPITPPVGNIEAMIAGATPLKYYGTKTVPGWIRDRNGKWSHITIIFKVHDVKRVITSTGPVGNQVVTATLGDKSNCMKDSRGTVYDLMQHGDHVWLSFYRFSPGPGGMVAPITDEACMDIDAESAAAQNTVIHAIPLDGSGLGPTPIRDPAFAQSEAQQVEEHVVQNGD